MQLLLCHGKNQDGNFSEFLKENVVLKRNSPKTRFNFYLHALMFTNNPTYTTFATQDAIWMSIRSYVLLIRYVTKAQRETFSIEMLSSKKEIKKKIFPEIIHIQL